jgi:glycosyltransferase involved in cell wall biosynthesis
MKRPMISVVMPIYNGEKFLKEAIDSIFCQSFVDFELIIVNDASKDNSEEIILSYIDERLKYIKNPVNLGLIGSLNVGIDNARGKYIARMDQDDISKTDRFDKQVSFMEKNPKVVICGMQGEVLGTNQRINQPEQDLQIRSLLFFGSPFIHPVVMIRKETLDSNKLRYDIKYFHAEDFGLWVNISFLGLMANLPDVGITYRKHVQQYTNVFTDGMKNTAFEAKKELLERLRIELNDNDLYIYEQLFKRTVDYKNDDILIQSSKFLNKFYKLIPNNTVDKKWLKKWMYRKWKIMCNERQKLGFSVYHIFLKNPMVFSFFEAKIHIWFLRKKIGF